LTRGYAHYFQRTSERKTLFSRANQYTEFSKRSQDFSATPLQE